MSQRVDKVKEALKEEISRILHGEINDPRIGFVTIARVEITPDLRSARVYYSVLGAVKKVEGGPRPEGRDIGVSGLRERRKVEGGDKTQAGLQSATGYIRKLIAERLKLRYTPEILFVFDDSIEYSQHMSNLIKKARESDKLLNDETN